MQLKGKSAETVYNGDWGQYLDLNESVRAIRVPLATTRNDAVAAARQVLAEVR